MRDTELNPLNMNQRKLLQWGVVFILVLFLIGYFFIQNNKSNRAVLEGSKLTVFDDTYMLKGYPDRLAIHYPYLLVIQADKPLTTIYNLNTKKKEKEVKDILLDYYDGISIYNRKATYLNDRNLDVYCDSAFLNDQEVYCITKVNKDFVTNKLISINLQNGLQKFVYQSDNLLTTVAIINNELYVGEVNTKTKQNYLTISKNSLAVENVVSIIYPVKGQPYFASFKSALNNQQENYYIIEGNTVSKVSNNKIVLYKN